MHNFFSRQYSLQEEKHCVALPPKSKRMSGSPNPEHSVVHIRNQRPQIGEEIQN